MSRKTKSVKAELESLRALPGREILAVSSNAWGRGGTAADAVQLVRKNHGKGEVVLFDAPAGSKVDDLGRVHFFPPDGKTWDDLTTDEQVAHCRLTEIARTTIRSR